ncbi:MAG: macro domain-containing protein [Nitrospirae bacterium]|nr:macro domain-containing protein [Nitrospirota bacterium]
MNKVHAEAVIAGRAVRIVEGDLTEQDADAIVNAANEHLQHGGGVAGAIVRKGGRIIQDESDAIGFTSVGTAVITGGGSLKAAWVIHTVGPRWGERDEDAKLANAVRSSLELAELRGMASISFPAVSAGIFGFPKDRCARVMVSAMASYLAAHPGGSLRRVDVCLLGGPLVAFFCTELQAIMKKTRG